MAKSKNPFPFGNPKVEKKEEKVGKDLDNDGEKGEPLAHQKKVLGPKAAKKEIPSGGLKKSGKMPFPVKKK